MWAYNLKNKIQKILYSYKYTTILGQYSQSYKLSSKILVVKFIWLE